MKLNLIQKRRYKKYLDERRKDILERQKEELESHDRIYKSMEII